MNQHTGTIFPLDTTAELATRSLSKDKVLANGLQDKWTESFQTWNVAEKFRRFDKFENILWVEKMMEKIGGRDKARQVSVVREVMDGLIGKKRFRCAQCKGFLGMKFARVKTNLNIVLEELIENAAGKPNLIQQEKTTPKEETHPQFLSPAFKPKQIVIQGGNTLKITTQKHTSLPTEGNRRKLIKEILKNEKLLTKICLQCFHNTTHTLQNQPHTTHSEQHTIQPSQFEEVTMGGLLDNYLSILAPSLKLQAWNKDNHTIIQEETPNNQAPNPSDPIPGRLYYLSSMSQRNIFKFNLFKNKSEFKRKMAILEFVKNHGGRVSNALENVGKTDRAQFIKEYLDIAVTQMHSAKNLVPNSFTYFYDINYWEHGRYSTFLKTLKKVKQSLQTEHDLSEFDALLANFVTSFTKQAVSHDANQNPLGKRNDLQFRKSDTNTNTEDSEAHTKLKAIMEKRAGRLEKFQTKKTNRILKEILHIMMSKFSKKLFLVEEYEKMLLHEDLVLDLKFNEILASKFMQRSNLTDN